MIRANKITAPSGVDYYYERLGGYFKIYEAACSHVNIAEGRLDKLNPTSPLNYWWIRRRFN